MFKSLISMTAATLLVLSTGPAFATHKDGKPHGDMSPAAESLEDSIATIFDVVRPRTIFATSREYTGDLVTEAIDAGLGVFENGILAANALCQDRADYGGSIVPEGEYVAFLSANDPFGGDIRSHLSPSIGPYVLPDGTVVAPHITALLGVESQTSHINARSTILYNRIDLDETGEPAAVMIWTGSDRFGTAVFLSNCTGWTSSAPTKGGEFGFTFEVIGLWLGGSRMACDNELGLYCVEQ